MKICFLGTSGSAPILGRNNLSLLIKSNKKSVLVDCSGSPAANILAFEPTISSVTDVLLTHHHTDHIYALPSLIHNIWLNNGLSEGKFLNVYGQQETIQFAKNLVSLFELHLKPKAVKIHWNDVKLRKAEKLKIDGIEEDIILFPVTHGQMPTTGFKIQTKRGENLVFSSDCIIDARLSEQVPNNLTHFVSDCGGGLHSTTGHAGVIDVAKFAQIKRVKNLYFTHLPQPSIINTEEILTEAKKHFSGNISVPSDADVIELT